jgi:2-polyprenyl-3-methyl-5-hydroxy-6-metoxy-1,4-benzoquinol methylase
VRNRLCNACKASVDRKLDLAWRKDGHDILRCRACGLRFRADLPSPTELPALYGAAYFHSGEHSEHGEGYADYLAEEDLHRLNARRRLRLLEGLVPPGALLDVGCAAGFFLDEARRRGWTVSGSELSAEMAGWAGKELEIVGIVQGVFAAQEWERGTFDVVTMWDYIEHTLDPAADLRCAAELLRPGGLLVLSTGDAGSALARLFGRRWHLLTPRHHNYFFTRKALFLALEGAGLTTLMSRHLAARYSARYLAHKLRTLSDLQPLRELERQLSRSRLGAWSVPVNLGDIVTVVARADTP